jgi:hypothetical protein
MIANGKKYTALREEYERILTALSLVGALKKYPAGFANRSPEASQACSYLEERRRNKITPRVIRP